STSQRHNPKKWHPPNSSKDERNCFIPLDRRQWHTAKNSQCSSNDYERPCSYQKPRENTRPRCYGSRSVRLIDHAITSLQAANAAFTGGATREPAGTLLMISAMT